MRALVLSLFALLLVGAAAVGAFALAGLFESDDDGGAAVGSIVSVQALRAYDPFGDNVEHDDEARLATDRDPATGWRTETYENFEATKDGVGLVIDAGRSTRLAQMTVTTNLPGFSAEIRSGSSAEGPFQRRVSTNRQVDPTTTFLIDGPAARYFVVWITSLDGLARINEVSARAAA